jgi:poly(A) polymerase
VNEADADIDTVCVAPQYVTREHFFDSLPRRLQERCPGLRSLNPIREAVVPIIELDVQGVSVDLQFLALPRPTVPDTLNVMDDDILMGLNIQDVRILNGPRTNELIFHLVPRYDSFLVLLRAVRQWAKARGLYSNKMGYFGGVNAALLAARIVQSYPNYAPASLLRAFFVRYLAWPWKSEPLTLTQAYTIKQYPDLNKEMFQPGMSNTPDYMPLLTPAYPQMTSTYSVGLATFNVILGEFRRGKEVTETIVVPPDFDVEGYLANSDSAKTSSTSVSNGTSSSSSGSSPSNPWEALFDPVDFFVLYDQYISITLSAASDADMRVWKGYMESRLRFLVQRLEHVDVLTDIRPFPACFETTEIVDVNHDLTPDMLPVVASAADPDAKVPLDRKDSVEDSKAGVLASIPEAEADAAPGNQEPAMSGPARLRSLAAEKVRMERKKLLQQQLQEQLQPQQDRKTDSVASAVAVPQVHVSGSTSPTLPVDPSPLGAPSATVGIGGSDQDATFAGQEDPAPVYAATASAGKPGHLTALERESNIEVAGADACPSALGEQSQSLVATETASAAAATVDNDLSSNDLCTAKSGYMPGAAPALVDDSSALASAVLAQSVLSGSHNSAPTTYDTGTDGSTVQVTEAIDEDDRSPPPLEPIEPALATDEGAEFEAAVDSVVQAAIAAGYITVPTERRVCVFFVGLAADMSQGASSRSVSVSSVLSYVKTTHYLKFKDRKTGMDVRQRVVQWRDLPAFVFGTEGRPAAERRKKKLAHLTAGAAASTGAGPVPPGTPGAVAPTRHGLTSPPASAGGDKVWKRSQSTPTALPLPGQIPGVMPAGTSVPVAIGLGIGIAGESTPGVGLDLMTPSLPGLGAAISLPGLGMGVATHTTTPPEVPLRLPGLGTGVTPTMATMAVGPRTGPIGVAFFPGTADEVGAQSEAGKKRPYTSTGGSESFAPSGSLTDASSHIDKKGRPAVLAPAPMPRVVPMPMRPGPRPPVPMPVPVGVNTGPRGPPHIQPQGQGTTPGATAATQKKMKVTLKN